MGKKTNSTGTGPHEGSSDSKRGRGAEPRGAGARRPGGRPRIIMGHGVMGGPSSRRPAQAEARQPPRGGQRIHRSGGVPEQAGSLGRSDQGRTDQDAQGGGHRLHAVGELVDVRWRSPELPAARCADAADRVFLRPERRHAGQRASRRSTRPGSVGGAARRARRDQGRSMERNDEAELLGRRLLRRSCPAAYRAAFLRSIDAATSAETKRPVSRRVTR